MVNYKEKMAYRFLLNIGNSHYNWEGFEGYGVRDQFIYLKLKDDRIIPVA